MKNLCALLRQKPRRLCRDCGDDPCVCNDAETLREAGRRRRLRQETDAAFADARADGAAFLARVRPDLADGGGRSGRG